MKPTKLLLIGLLAILLTGCSKYRYDVKYEKCNGSTGSISYEGISIPLYSGKERLLYIGDGINNVCDFSYIKTLIQDNQ